MISALDGRTHYVRTAPEFESFGQAFSKACEGLGRVAPFYPSKNAGEGEFLCKAKEEGEPSSGVLPNSAKAVL